MEKISLRSFIGFQGLKRPGQLEVAGPRRTFIFLLVMGCVLVVFMMRLIELQIVRGEEFRTQADENRFFTRYLPAVRGVFLDRDGVALVKNVPEYKLATEETRDQTYPNFEPVSEEEGKQLLSNDERNLVVDQRRDYIFGPAFFHVLGFTGEASREELQEHPEFSLGENVGKLGLERTLQRLLAGKKGRVVYEMRATGELTRTILKEEPVQGRNVLLTLDAGLTQRASELLAGRPGAVIMSDIRTGELLVLVSSPSVNPSNVASGLEDKFHPMLNRSITGNYPPGSTFKLMTALAALESGALDADTEIEDTGELTIGEFSFGNWYYRQYGRTEGLVNLVKALQRSNDIYFYKAAELVGPDKIAETATRFRFGVPTGVELPGESSGLVPTPGWKQERLGESWTLGNTYHMGIGQGDVLVTPIQLNQATAAIANEGTWCQPHLLKDSRTNCESVGVSDDALAVVRDGMRAACQSGGTGYPFFDGQPVSVLCKTGTAEYGAADERGYRNTHAWFTAAAPADAPVVAVTVLLEATEDTQYLEGSADAAPIAKELLKLWAEETL